MNLKKLLQTLAIFIIVCCIYCSTCSASTEYSGYAYSDYIAYNLSTDKNIPGDAHDTGSEESRLRRFEISFFISLPFVFIINFIVLHSYRVAREGDLNVSVWKHHKTLLLTGTLSVTSLVAAREAATFRDNSPEKKAVRRENDFLICFTRKF